MHKNENDVTNYARATRTLIKWLAGILVLIFGWLQFNGLPIGEIVGSVSGDLLVKLALCIYYLSWAAGTFNDVDEQETAYAEAPTQGHLPRNGILISICVAAVFGLLCYVPSAKAFSVVLAIFLALNVLGYVYVLKIVGPIAEKSKAQYLKDEDHRSVIKLDIVWRYMSGPWQWFRFAYGFVAVGVVLAASFSRLPQLLSSKYPEIPPETYVALSILLFVITMEGWIWAMRIRAKIAQSTVDFVIDTFPQALKPAGSQSSAGTEATTS